MKREISFRGNAINPFDGWVFGFLNIVHDDITDRDAYYIINNGTSTIVYPASVGEFSGELDLERNKIYEGDLMRWNKNCIIEVIFKDGCFGAKLPHSNGVNSWIRLSRMKIIGNVYQNPELICNNLN